MCALQTLRAAGFRADPVWGVTFQGGDTQSAPEEDRVISLYVCVRCVFLSILFCCDHNSRREGCWAGELAWGLVNHHPPLTSAAISVPPEQRSPPSSGTYSSGSEAALARFPCRGSATWPAAGLGCHRSCWVTRVPRCEGKASQRCSPLTPPRCLSARLRARPQPLLPKHNLWGAAAVSCWKTPPRASFPPVSLRYSVCLLWLFAWWRLWRRSCGVRKRTCPEPLPLNKPLARAGDWCEEALPPALPSQNVFHRTGESGSDECGECVARVLPTFWLVNPVMLSCLSDRYLSETTGRKVHLRWQEVQEGLLCFPCL